MGDTSKPPAFTRTVYAASKTGVFIGQWTSDYEACVYHDSPKSEFYATTGSGRYAASGRLSFHFDLRGPSLTVDTACSSSLVALHLACRSLQSRDCEMALAGGVNVILRPEVTLAYSRRECSPRTAAASSATRRPTATCAARAQYCLLIEAICRCEANGDRIHALIRGSADQQRRRKQRLPDHA